MAKFLSRIEELGKKIYHRIEIFVAIDLPSILVRIWYDPVNAYPETGGLAGRWTLNSSDEMAD